MEKRVLISSGARWEPIVGYSRAVQVGRQVWVSGTLAKVLPDGSITGGDDAYLQAKDAFRIIFEALAKVGGEPRHVVRTRLYLRSAEDEAGVAKAHGEIFGEIRPATAMIIIGGFVHPQGRVEIEADAYLHDV